MYHNMFLFYYRKTKLVPKFKEYDKDGNNYITLEEASSILQKPPFEFPAGKVTEIFTPNLKCELCPSSQSIGMYVNSYTKNINTYQVRYTPNI